MSGKHTTDELYSYPLLNFDYLALNIKSNAIRNFHRNLTFVPQMYIYIVNRRNVCFLHFFISVGTNGGVRDRERVKETERFI